MYNDSDFCEMHQLKKINLIVFKENDIDVYYHQLTLKVSVLVSGNKWYHAISSLHTILQGSQWCAIRGGVLGNR